MIESVKKTINCFFDSDGVRSAAVAWAAAFVVLFALNMLAWPVFAPSSLLHQDIVIAAGDALLFSMPVWLLGRRWRWVQLVIVWVVALFLLANVLYVRYWGDMIAFTLIFSANSYNSVVVGAVPGLLQWSDSVYILLPVLLTDFWCLAHVDKAPVVPRQTKWLAAGVSVLGFALVYVVSGLFIRSYMRNSTGNPDVPLSLALESKIGASSNNAAHWHGNGLTVYIVNEIIEMYKARRITLSDEQRAQVDDYLSRHREYQAEPMAEFAANKDKNLIFVVVESLNSSIVGKTYDGRALTPVLDSLLTAQGTVSCLNVYPQIKGGGSSDGQLIYNTGLLPVNNGSAALNFGDNAYPSLAKSIGYKDNFEVIFEPGYIWNHNVTSRSYGYDRLVDNLDATGTGMDAAVFNKALQEIKKAPQPFFAEVVTLSMHFPYIDDAAPRYAWIDALPGLDKTTVNYLQTVHYFDACLGTFIQGLHNARVADNSVVVLASDHSQIVSNRDLDPDNETSQPIVFMALNTGVTESVSGPVSQSDVYPTVLQIMDKLPADGYRGLGMSILDARNTSARDGRGQMYGQSAAPLDKLKTDAFAVSDLMIRSDWFSTK